MTLREGYQTTGVQRLGRVADALHNALCQSAPAGPGREPVIRVFPAWPREWEAEFTLLCRDGFLVTSAIRNGEIEFVEIVSQTGARCRVRNPWPATEVALHRKGHVPEALTGDNMFYLAAFVASHENRSGSTPLKWTAKKIFLCENLMMTNHTRGGRKQC
jgi:hypothetical protein